MMFFALLKMRLLPLVAMMRCLPKNVAKPRIIRRSRHHWRSQHHLQKANIIQKTHFCLPTKVRFFVGVEGALHFMYTISYFFMQLFLQDFAVGS
jgi:hypothetical protein